VERNFRSFSFWLKFHQKRYHWYHLRSGGEGRERAVERVRTMQKSQAPSWNKRWYHQMVSPPQEMPDSTAHRFSAKCVPASDFGNAELASQIVNSENTGIPSPVGD